MQNGQHPEASMMPFDAPPRPARVMVCIGYNPASQRLIERAGMLAAGLGAELFAVHIQTDDSAAPCYRTVLEQNIQFARTFNAQIVVERAAPLADAMARIAHEHGITLIVMGESARSRWAEVHKGSLVRQVLHASRDIDVYVVADPS